MALGYHLSANQNVGPTTADIIQKLAVCLFTPRGVTVHTINPGLRKKTLYLRLHPLCAKAEGFQGLPLTLRADWGNCHGQAAQVTPQFLPGPVPGETYGTIAAVGNITAVTTEEKICITSAVDQQESLLALRKCIGQGLAQGMRYKISLSLVFHIYDGYLGQRPVINAVR